MLAGGSEMYRVEDTMRRIAVNAGIKKSQEMVQEEMGKVTGGLNIPGMF